MQRNELERLSRDELIELVLRLQRSEKTSRTSSKPQSTDRKERREQAKPGGAKPGHEGHSRMLSTNPDQVVDHAPQQCPCCCGALSPDLLIERTQAGLSRARVEGKRLGRPASLTLDQRGSVARRLGEGGGVSALACEFKTSRQIILRIRDAMPAT